MDDIVNYVCGFAFLGPTNEVLLINKRRPAWQRGCLNGIGGKIEAHDKTHRAAMVREFEEEAGIKTTVGEWIHYHSLNYPKTRAFCHFFACTLTTRKFELAIDACPADQRDLPPEEQERVNRYTLSRLQYHTLVPNVGWLAVMAHHFLWAERVEVPGCTICDTPDPNWGLRRV